MVGRVPAFQPGVPGSILGGVRNFNFSPGIGCVSFVCILSCVVFGGGPDIVLATLSGRPALVYLSSMGGSPGELRACDVGEAKEGLVNEL